MKAPTVIYLQWHGEAPTTYTDDDDNEVTIPEEEMDVDLDSVTWCSDRIYDADIPYRRDDQECVWERYTEKGYIRDCTGDLGYDPEKRCGNCGNRIRVEEQR